MSEQKVERGWDWYRSEEGRAQFEAQRDASIALRATLESRAAEQKHSREIAEAQERFANGVEQLQRVDGLLAAGVPVENLKSSDLRFLLGAREAKQIWDSTGSSRKIRWRRAVESLPDLPRKASDHVRSVYVETRVTVHTAEKHRLLHTPKQAFRFYQETARLATSRAVVAHVAAGCEECTLAQWGFILDHPTYMKPGEVFEPDGITFKPAEEDPA